MAELSWQYRIDEMRLWQSVYQCAAGVFQKLKKDHPYPDWVDADYAKFTKKKWNFKSLLSMSLLDYDADYVYTALQNPMHGIHHSMTNRDIQ